jgi:uncharacterized protein DUF6283
MTGFPYRKFPCGACPWKRSSPPGQFPAGRYEDLRCTAADTPTRVLASLTDPRMFGCHEGEPGSNADLACAGWLAVCGRDHLLVRMAVLSGRLPPEALGPGDNWPELYASYSELAAANGAGEKPG